MYKLILADDEYELRNGLGTYFPWEEIGFELAASLENGQQVIEYLESHSADVLLCDIRMPVMDGLEVAQYIYRKKLPIYMIMFSGYRDFEYAKKAMQYGARDYIVKSAKFNELVSVFRNLREQLDMENSKKKLAGASKGYYQQIIETIQEQVEREFATVTLEQVAAAVHMNSNYVSKLFYCKTGQLFSEYLLSVKMKKAAEYLSDIRYRTYEVSELVGYSNTKNFSRAFKSFYGITPKEYREGGR